MIVVSRNRWILIALAFVISIGGCSGLWLWSGKSSKVLAAAYQTVQVRKGSLDVKISGTGNIAASQRQSIKASAGQIAAKLKPIEALRYE